MIDKFIYLIVDENGQALTEYSFILALVVITVFIVLASFYPSSLKNLYNNINNGYNSL